ncbi:VG15 protein [Microbacterium sp.]|uniref:VG15 protein n=1 Tax=Microbacterium sp. TaxID=51671 RepID=UPI002FE3C49C
MVDRDDINRLTSETRAVLDEARRDLMSLAGQFDLANPAQVRDALLELVPMLVNEYGELAAVAAAEWYEDVRPVGGFTTQLADVADEEAVRGSVQALAGGLWDDVPSDAIEQISASMQRHIKYSSRATIARNVAADPMRPRYGRVPKGAKTCAWCEMLASRGFVYVTEETAGIIEDHYHDECDCEIVCSWDADQAHIAGYDPDAMYDRYLTARQQLEAEGMPVHSDADIAARMRELFPDQYTDGHIHEAA